LLQRGHRFSRELRPTPLTRQKSPRLNPGKAHGPIDKGPLRIIGLELSPQRHRGFLNDLLRVGAVWNHHQDRTHHHRLVLEKKAGKAFVIVGFVGRRHVNKASFITGPRNQRKLDKKMPSFFCGGQWLSRAFLVNLLNIARLRAVKTNAWRKIVTRACLDPNSIVGTLCTGTCSSIEALASFLRRIGVCEERGSGVDKVVFQTEFYQLPAPSFETPEGSTRAVLFAHKQLGVCRT